MFLETTCESISASEWERLMKGRRPISHKWLVNKIKRELPDLYVRLQLNLYNPYHEKTYSTKTHYVLTWSSVEYFIAK